MKPAIKIERLSKKYRIGSRHLSGYRTLRESLVGAGSKTWRSLRSFARDVRRRGADDSPILWALSNVSFNVQPGEVVGIIGRNGAGKSTLLKILSRITEPTTGRAAINGRVGSLLEVGTGFHPELTGRENVYMNGTILGMSKRDIDRKFEEIVDFSGVGTFLNTPIKRYSSGMQVRLAFAVAAHLDPEILVVDEVLAVGDAEFQNRCIGKMHDVASEGRTVLFVSHNLAAVESLCDRAVLLVDGSLKLYTTAHDCIRQYRRDILSASRLDDQNARPPCSVERLIKAATLVDDSGLPTHSIPLGSRFCLHLSLGGSDLGSITTLGVGIDDAFAQRLLTLHTPPTWLGVGHAADTADICCSVESFPLAPGEYQVKIAAGARGQTIDTVERALTFQVHDSPAFGEGRSFTRGVCVAPSLWNTHSVSVQ